MSFYKYSRNQNRQGRLLKKILVGKNYFTDQAVGKVTQVKLYFRRVFVRKVYSYYILFWKRKWYLKHYLQKQAPEVLCKKEENLVSEISQILQESTCARVTLLKKRLRHRGVPVNFAKFLRTLSEQFLYKTPLGDCFCTSYKRKNFLTWHYVCTYLGKCFHHHFAAQYLNFFYLLWIFIQDKTFQYLNIAITMYFAT